MASKYATFQKGQFLLVYGPKILLLIFRLMIE